MNLLKNVFSKKDASIKSHEDFWSWFQDNEKPFFNVVKQKGDVEKEFFNKLSPKLNELKDGFFYLTGMYDSNTVELVITADGTIKNIVFVEELVKAAPQIKGWIFTALKSGMDINNVSIEMAGYEFKSENLNFYPNEPTSYTDEIDITIVHDNLTENNKDVVANGSYIFLDNYLGELEFATIIDNLKVESPIDAKKELIPIKKLKDFLNWRQKEFIEKYEGIRHNTENDEYAMLEAELQNGNALLAVINTDVLNWDSKASHPWILNVEINYNGENNNGMPDETTYILLEEIENKILDQLKDFDGYINIGRETANSIREIYFACKDFRKPSKVLYKIQDEHSDKVKIDYDIYKDKYWKSFDRFK